MSRLNATDRLRRLLAVIPWANGRGEVSLDEIVERFDYPLERLRRDLTDVVQFVGVYPHTPDMLIEVDLDEENERVRFELADYFTSPLRLTPDEALSLVSAGLGLLGTSAGENGALERALTKVADRFDLELGDEIEVSLGGASAAMVEQTMSAARRGACIEIEYHSLHRGEGTLRVVEPHNVFSQQGEWYLRGYCRLAAAERTFRLDRVLAMQETGEFVATTEPTTPSVFAPGDDDMRVTLRLAPSARWVVDAFPVESVKETKRHITVTLAVSSTVWLERLLLQLGPAATLVSSTPPLPETLRHDAASRVLARYRDR
ncbi:MAG: WYL domain-containing protein [Actinomycetota bacterium]